MTDKKYNIDKISKELNEVYAHKVAVEKRSFLTLMLCGALLSFFGLFIIDYLTDFPAAIRVLMTIVVAFAFAYYLPKKRGPVEPDKDVIEIAKEVELKAGKVKKGGFHSILVSATEFATKSSIEGSEELKGLTVKAARKPDFSPKSLILHDEKLVEKSKKALIAFCVIYAVWGALGHNSFMKFYGRAIGLPMKYLTDTRIEKVDIPNHIMINRDATIRVLATGKLPTAGHALITYEGESEFDVQLVQKQPGTYEGVLKSPPKSFSFTVKLGDDSTAVHKVAVVAAPEIKISKITVKSPKYTGEEDSVQELGNLEILENSVTNISITPNKDVTKCELVYMDKFFAGVKTAEGSYLIRNVKFNKSDKFSIKLVDALGVENIDRLYYSVNVLKDMKPEVEIRKPEHGSYYSPVSTIKWEAVINDDIGADKVYLAYSVKKTIVEGESTVTKVINKETLKELKTLNGVKNTVVAGELKAKDLEADINTHVEMRIFVTDSNPHRDKNDKYGKSEEKIIQIVSSEELRDIIDSEKAAIYNLIKDINTDISEQREILEKLNRRSGK